VVFTDDLEKGEAVILENQIIENDD